MRAVVDTNVLVSGLIKQGTPPAEVVADVLAGELVPLYDQRIIGEYREVLSRPKLRIPTEKVDALLELIIADGLEVLDAHFAGSVPLHGTGLETSRRSVWWRGLELRRQ